MKITALFVYLAAAAASLVFAAPQATAALADAAPTKTSTTGSQVTGGSDKGGDTDKYHHGGWDRYSPKYCFRKCGFDYDYYHKKHDWDWEVRCFKRCLRRKDYDDHDWKAKRTEEAEEDVIQKRGLDEHGLKVDKRGYNDQNYDEDKKHRDHDYDRYRCCKYRKHRHDGHSYDDEDDGGRKGW